MMECATPSLSVCPPHLSPWVALPVLFVAAWAWPGGGDECMTLCNEHGPYILDRIYGVRQSLRAVLCLIDPMSTAKYRSLTPHSSDVHVFHCAAAANAKPLPEEKITLGFEHVNAPVLVGKCRHESNAVKCAALTAYCDQVKMPGFAVQFLRAGIVQALYASVADADGTTRTLVAKAFGATTRAPNGTEKIVEVGIEKIAPLVDDRERSVRTTVYDALEIICKSMKGNSAAVKAGFVSIMIQKCATEEGSLQPVCLRVLYTLLQCPGGHSLVEARENGGIRGMIALLKHDQDAVKEYASKCLALLCDHIEPKGIAINAGAVSVLTNDYLSSSNNRVVSGGACALMGLLTELQGKTEFMNNGGTEKLVDLFLQNPDRMVQLHILKSISSLAPHPVARKMMNVEVVVNRLKDMEYGTDKLLSKSARKTLELIQWVP